MLEWLQAFWDWLSGLGPYLSAGTAWTVLALGILAGLAGVVLPIIPGAVVLLAAAVLHKWMLPDLLSWWGVGALAVCVVLDRLVDVAGTAAGSRWFGGTRWGVIGAIAGGVVGLFFGFFGILLGPVAGAILLELAMARRGPREAARSGMGAGVGYGLGMAGRFAVYLLMVAIVAADLYIVGEETPQAEQAATAVSGDRDWGDPIGPSGVEA